MPGLDPGIFFAATKEDGRIKSGHEERGGADPIQLAGFASGVFAFSISAASVPLMASCVNGPMCL